MVRASTIVENAIQVFLKRAERDGNWASIIGECSLRSKRGTATSGHGAGGEDQQRGPSRGNAAEQEDVAVVSHDGGDKGR